MRVDDLGERPGRVRRAPRVIERIDARRPRHSVGNDRTRRREADIRADAGTLSELLGHPPLDATRRDSHHVGHERIRVADLAAQFVDELVRALGTVHD